MSRQVGEGFPSVTNVEEAELPQGLQEESVPAPAAQHKVNGPKARVILTYSGLSRYMVWDDPHLHENAAAGAQSLLSSTVINPS